MVLQTVPAHHINEQQKVRRGKDRRARRRQRRRNFYLISHFPSINNAKRRVQSHRFSLCPVCILRYPSPAAHPIARTHLKTRVKMVFLFGSDGFAKRKECMVGKFRRHPIFLCLLLLLFLGSARRCIFPRLPFHKVKSEDGE